MTGFVLLLRNWRAVLSEPVFQSRSDIAWRFEMLKFLFESSFTSLVPVEAMLKTAVVGSIGSCSTGKASMQASKSLHIVSTDPMDVKSFRPPERGCRSLECVIQGVFDGHPWISTLEGDERSQLQAHAVAFGVQGLAKTWGEWRQMREQLGDPGESEAAIFSNIGMETPLQLLGELSFPALLAAYNCVDY